jgi:integrase
LASRRNYQAVFAAIVYRVPVGGLALAARRRVRAIPSLLGLPADFLRGLRPSEIGRTRTSDFALIDCVWYLDYRSKSESAKGDKKVKKSASARLVPIPRLLMDLGILDRRDELLAVGEERMFPQWKVYVHKKSGREMWGHDFSKSWQYIKIKFGFSRDALTLYGGRHTRAT